MGEARRRRMVGEDTPRPVLGGVLREVAAEDARDMPGHLRLTVLDDDDRGVTAYYPAVDVTEHLGQIGDCRFGTRRVRDLGADVVGWARLRNTAFDFVRDPALRLGAAELALWCVMHGPSGESTRRMVSEALAEDGKATIVMRRYRPTGSVATAVTGDPGAKELARIAELAAGAADRLPAGTMAVVAARDADPPRKAH